MSLAGAAWEGTLAENGSLTPKQHAALAALVHPANRTIGAAAEAAGVPERTLYRWLEAPEFVTALEAAQAAAVGGAVRTLAALATEAAGTLGELLGAGYAPSVRLRAATAILEDVLRLREHLEFEERLRKLEEQQ